MAGSDLISKLVAAATNALSMPRRNEEDDLAALHEAIAIERCKPAPDGRIVFDEHLLLAQALQIHARYLREGSEARAATIEQLIGVMLAPSRRDLFNAMRIERGMT